jgi:predicted RND superfamily exporter protein
MSEHNDRYGINMKKYCRDHETAMRSALDEMEHRSSHPGTVENIPCATEGARATNFSIDLKRSDEKSILLHETTIADLLEYHLEKMRWIQHERLIHLIVTVMVVFIELFVVYLTILHPELGILPPIIMLGLAVLLGFYFYHYFFLENAVQRWYRIEDELEKEMSER